MRKRERENPCFICSHYHKYEEGEPCSVCGHRPQDPNIRRAAPSAFPDEMIPSFLYVGSYDNASRLELLREIGIRRIVNTVPACQNLYKNTFHYHTVTEGKRIPFEEAIAGIEEAHHAGEKVLVYCMTGVTRSNAVIIGYLITRFRWPLSRAYEYVRERRSILNITPDAFKQLQEFEARALGQAPTGILADDALPRTERGGGGGGEMHMEGDVPTSSPFPAGVGLGGVQESPEIVRQGGGGVAGTPAAAAASCGPSAAGGGSPFAAHAAAMSSATGLGGFGSPANLVSGGGAGEISFSFTSQPNADLLLPGSFVFRSGT